MTTTVVSGRCRPGVGGGGAHAATPGLRRSDRPRRCRDAPAVPAAAAVEGVPARRRGRRPVPAVRGLVRVKGGRGPARHAGVPAPARHPVGQARRRPRADRRRRCCSRPAAGARRLPGATGDRVRYLRTLDDAARISALIQPGGHVVVIGGGFIGSEVAASARARGADVTMIEMLEVPLLRVLGSEIGAVCARSIVAAGRTCAFAETPSVTPGRATGSRCVPARGEPSRATSSSSGWLSSRTSSWPAAGLEVANGIVVDEHLRTSVEGIYAAGDVANVAPAFREAACRALRQREQAGAVAANNILGRDTVFDDAYWFWSDQYDLNLQYTGHATTWDEIAVRGSDGGPLVHRLLPARRDRGLPGSSRR